MKLATFNIKNLNKRLPNPLAWVKSAKPDVVCLQELKAEQDAFPLAAIGEAAGRDEFRQDTQLIEQLFVEGAPGLINGSALWR